MAKTWITKTTKLSDGSRMTTRMGVGESLMYDLIKGACWLFIVLPLKICYWIGIKLPIMAIKAVIGVFKKGE